MKIRMIFNLGMTRLGAFNFAMATAATMAFGIGYVQPSVAATAEPVSFAKQVLPIFESHCIACHSAGGVGQISSALNLTSYKELRYGSVRGVQIIPFHSDRSAMMRDLKDNWESDNPNALKMPPLGPRLSPADLKIISDWIDQGAKNN
jgi:mono/diheme cytochrome c family protein